MMYYSFQKKITLLMACLGLISCSQEKKKEQSTSTPPPLPVTTLTMHSQRLPSTLEVIGQTEGVKEIEVRARVGGWLIKQYYQEGTIVKTGQPLFQLDRAPFEIAVSQAHATLQEALARVTQAKRELSRLQELIVTHAVSQKEVDDAKTNHQLAAAGLERAQAELRQAKLNLSYTRVTAPTTGLSGRALRTEGNLIGTGSSDSLLTTLSQIHPIRARFSLSENDILKLGIAQFTPLSISKVELILPDGKTYPHPGKLDFLAGQIDPALGTRSLRALFDNRESQVLPGQFVRVRLLTRQEKEAFIVPQVAVAQNDKGFNVFLVSHDNKVTPQPVQAGEWSGSNWLIKGGLKEGDRVIIDNIIKLKPGMTVAPKEAATTSAKS